MKVRELWQIGERLYQEQLDNGLQLVVLPKRDYSKTYAIFTTRYGSIDNHFRIGGREVSVPDGIAHFLEHKMFEEEQGDVFQKFSRQGASANAFTSFTRTSYLFSCTEQVKENLFTLLDFVQSPYFTEQSVEKEKGIIGQEIKMYEDDPEWRVYFGLLQGFYQKNPVRIDIAGTVESITSIDKETLLLCYETFYHPGNMMLFVVGNVEPEQVLQWVTENQGKKQFSPLPPIERLYPPEPEGVSEARKETHLPVGMPKLMFGFKEASPQAGNDLLRQEVATDVLLEVLFGPSSVLYQDLYQRNWIDEHFGYSYEAEENFAFSMMGGDSPQPEKVLQEVRQMVAERLGQGVQKEEFERAKRKKTGQFLRSLNSLEALANQFTAHHMQGSDFFAILQILEELRLEQVNQRLQEHLRPEQMSVSLVL